MSAPTRQEIIASRDLIVEVFKNMRSALLEAYGKYEYTTKADGSPVTALDITLEELVKERLLAEYHGFGFCGEETGLVAGEYDATWYVDPIDSTVSFLRGMPFCTNMAGLVVGGEIVASVIYDFVADELFTAIKGEGSFVNDRSLKIHDAALEDSLIFTDAYSYTHFYNVFAPNKTKFYAPVGATGNFMLSVASGKVQAVCYYGAKLKPHDVIPGALLISEAGGEIVSLSDTEFNYQSGQFIAGTPSICALAREHKFELRA